MSRSALKLQKVGREVVVVEVEPVLWRESACGAPGKRGKYGNLLYLVSRRPEFN